MGDGDICESSDYLRIANELLEDNTRLKIDESITAFQNALNAFAYQPVEGSYQQEYVNTKKKLRTSVLKMQAEFYSGTVERLAEIRAERWFTIEFVDQIDEIMQQNSMTPAVGRTEVNLITQSRAEFVT